MPRRRRLAVAIVTVATAVLMGGCGDEEADRLSVDNGPVEGGNGIIPAKLTAKEGNQVEIEVKNTAPDKEHGFTIEEFDVAEVIEQGKSTTVKFKADKAGTFRVYCQLHPTHKEAQLVVS